MHWDAVLGWAWCWRQQAIKHPRAEPWHAMHLTLHPLPFPRVLAGVAVKKPVIGNCNAYKVVAGDTLYTIAAAFQTTFAQLAQVNPAVADGVLTVGSEIFIPP